MSYVNTALTLRGSTIERNIEGNVVLTTPPVQIQTVLRHAGGRNFFPVNPGLLRVRGDKAPALYFRLLSPLTPGAEIGRLNHVQLIDRALEAIAPKPDPREAARIVLAAKVEEAQQALRAAQAELDRLG